MAQEKYGFFDSSGEDTRSYNAADMAIAFHSLASNGVAALDTNLQVTAEGSTMRTLVGYGTAMIEGYYYKLRDDGSGIQAFTHTTEAELNHIDRIILRLDFTARTIAVTKLIGTAAATPEAPELTRDDEIYELSLAQVLVQAGASEILSADITDERDDDDVCGLIAPESLRVSSIISLIAEQTSGMLTKSEQSLTSEEQTQVQTNLKVVSADDVKTRMYSSFGNLGLVSSATLTLEEILAAMPSDSMVHLSPDTGATSNISPDGSRTGTLYIYKMNTTRVDIRFSPKTDDSIWTNYAYYSGDAWVVGTWRQITVVKEVSATLSSGSWSGTGPYTQAVTVSGMTSAKKAIVGLALSATTEQFEAALDALLHVTSQGTDTITVTAEGDEPSVDIPILIEIVG